MQLAPPLPAPAEGSGTNKNARYQNGGKKFKMAQIISNMKVKIFGINGNFLLMIYCFETCKEQLIKI